MSGRILPALRRLLRGSDRSRAVADEKAAIARYTKQASSLEERLKREFGPRKLGIVLGEAEGRGWSVVLDEKRLAAAIVVVGPSGSGKSYGTALLARGLFESGVARLAVLDPKNETADLMPGVLIAAGRRLGPEAREDLFSRVALVDLFGAEALPPLNVLAPVPGLDPETLAYDVSTVLANQFDDLGVRQDALRHRVFECLARAALPLTALPLVLEAPEVLYRLAEIHGPAELFRSTARRIEKEGKERVLGLMARAEKLLRLRVTRLALGGSPRMLDYERLLREVVALVRLGSEQNAPDVTRMLQAILWLGIGHAVRRRPNGAPRTHVIVEEAPAFLGSGGREMADQFEDLARLARSKRVHFMLLSQDLVSLSKISPSLVEVLRGNAHIFITFRAMADSAWDFLLPVTGRRRKPPGAPWESERGGYLERGAELALLRQELSRLPDRHCYFVDRRTSLPGVRLRTADLVLDATRDEVEALKARARRHPILVPTRELERGYDEVMRRMHELLGGVAASSQEPERRAAVRRAQGKLDIG